MIELLFMCAVIGCWAAVFDALQEPDEAFEWVPEFRNRFASFGKHGALESWNKSKLQIALLNWMGECAKCHAGFLALWAYPLLYADYYSYINHFIVLVFSIYLAMMFQKTIKWSPN